MSWNIMARKISPCERARSQHSEWRGDVPDSVRTMGLQPAAHSSHLCWQQPCHIPGGTPRAASSKGAMGRDVAACSQDGITRGISSSTTQHSLPAANMWGQDFPPSCWAISWCPTAVQWCWWAEAHSELCQVSPTLRATLAQPGVPYQHLTHPKAGKGVTHMEVTPRAGSPKLGSPRVWRVQVHCPTTPSWIGRQPWGCAHENVTHTARDAQADAHTGRALHRLMPLKHSWMGEWSPSLQHQWDADLSHSFRLSLQQGGRQGHLLSGDSTGGSHLKT